jgi:hypothetical protein
VAQEANSAQGRLSALTSASLEDRRVKADEDRVQIEREGLGEEKTRNLVSALALGLPLLAVAAGFWQFRRNLQGQAQLKVLDFAEEGYDPEDVLRCAQFAAELLRLEVPPNFVSRLNKAEVFKRHLPFPVVEHRSALIEILGDATTDKRTEIIKYWNACFNDYRPGDDNWWFNRLARQVGVQLP